MFPFNIQERDLDLILLEELHADTGFAAWLARRVGLGDCRFIGASHSVVAKVAERVGETDVQAVFEKDGHRIAVLIEDKIAAAFTDRQAERYHERARAVVAAGEASEYLTVLIAPSTYLAGVPGDDPWHHRVAVEELADWFAAGPGAHAKWRADALASCLQKAKRNAAATDAESLRFAQEFAAYLAAHHVEFRHRPTGDRWGLIVHFTGSPHGVQLAWKVDQDAVDLTLTGEQLGKLAGVPPQVGLIPRIHGAGSSSDILRAPVTSAVWSEPLADQSEAREEVVAALQRLRSLALEIAAMPSVVQK